MTEYKMKSHIKKMTKYIYYNKYTLDKLKKKIFSWAQNQKPKYRLLRQQKKENIYISMVYDR